MEYSIRQTPECFEVTAHGEVQPQDLKEMAFSLYTKEQWVPGTAVLFDLQGLDFSSFDKHLVQESARNAKDLDHLLGPAKAAIVLASDLSYGLGNMWLSYAVDLQAQTKLFRNIEAARDWLKEQADAAVEDCA